MMRRFLAAFYLALLASSAAAEAPPRDQTASDPAAEVRAAALLLVSAIDGLAEAETAPDQITALTALVQAHEAALSGLRGGLAGLDAQEADMAAELAGRSDQIAALLGALVSLQRIDGPALLAHPEGALASVRAGMLMAGLAPALQADARALAAELARLAEVRDSRALAARALDEGLDSLRSAHDALAVAMDAGQPPPPPLGQDEALLMALLDSAQTLEILSAGLASLVPGDPSAAPALTGLAGSLPLPVSGRLVSRQMQGGDDSARPVLVIETAPEALVTAPVAGLLRYAGRLEDYGNVILLEPGEGYLLLIAGLGMVYHESGVSLQAGAPLGLMPGHGNNGDADGRVTVEDTGNDTDGSSEDEPLDAVAPRLYVELRQGGQPIDPGVWFDLTVSER